MEIVKVVGPTDVQAPDPQERFTTWIIDGRQEHFLQTPLYADGPSDSIPPSYHSRPVFVTLVRDGFVEPSSGYAFTSDRRFIHETAMNGRLRDAVAARYDGLDFSAASAFDGGEARFVVSNQRTTNYCRWWLDQVSKYFVFDAARPFHSVPASAMRYVSGALGPSFQKETFSALNLFAQTDFPEPLLLRGNFYVSSGLTFAGGQRISGRVTCFRRFVLDRLDRNGAAVTTHQTPRRFYITRAKTKMRRVLNEGELDPILERNGFVKLALEDLSIAEQISTFRAADVVVSPHGAGLTNVMFCRPGARMLEIFPEGGLHPSAFMRLASLCGLGYGYMCADSVANRSSAKNPNNADIVCPPESFKRALAAILNGLGQSP